MLQIRWLLEDEIVSALRHSRVIASATLNKVAEHVFQSNGRSHCHCEEVPLQFVFGPEQSLEKFKEVRPRPPGMTLWELLWDNSANQAFITRMATSLENTQRTHIQREECGSLTQRDYRT